MREGPSMTSKNIQIDYDANELRRVCKKHSIIRLAFFGSVVRDDFDQDNSDIDILVEFAEGKRLGFGIIDVIDDLSVVFGGRNVDLMTFKQLTDSRISKAIKEDARVVYEQTAA